MTTFQMQLDKNTSFISSEVLIFYYRLTSNIQPAFVFSFCMCI